MEIERKYLIDTLPADYASYPVSNLEQCYLCTSPVVRARREDDKFYLTYKSGGLMAREEYNLPLTEEAYLHLREKADGLVITKKRYRIPYDETHTIELDLFEGPLAPLILAEVEFASLAEAEAFTPPAWFGEDVTFQGDYHNSVLSKNGLPHRADRV